jgi:hypothetical protein
VLNEDVVTNEPVLTADPLPPVELIVTIPNPFEGVTVTFVPAIIWDTPPFEAYEAVPAKMLVFDPVYELKEDVVTTEPVSTAPPPPPFKA